MKFKRNKVVMISTRAVVAIVIVTIASVIYKQLEATRPTAAISEESNTAPPVTVMVAQTVPLRQQWEGFGTVRAMDSADVPSRLTATIAEIPDHILAGAFVGRDELLARLDSSDYEQQVEIGWQTIAGIDAQLEQLAIEKRSWAERLELVREEVQLARDDFERLQEAFARDAARQRELDQSRQGLIAAIRNEVSTQEEASKLPARRTNLLAQRAAQEASLKLAEENLRRTEIRSPIAGVLESVDVEVGESLLPGARIARVINLNHVEVPLLLPASSRAFISVGDDVRLRSGTRSGESWQATVSRIAPRDDEATRTTTVYVEVRQDDDDGAILPPGRFVQGLVASRGDELASIVPRRAVLSNQVQVVENGVILTREVQIASHIEGEFPQFGLPDTQWVVLEELLEAGTLVVVDAARGFVDGARVGAFAADGTEIPPQRRPAS